MVDADLAKALEDPLRPALPAAGYTLELRLAASARTTLKVKPPKGVPGCDDEAPGRE